MIFVFIPFIMNIWLVVVVFFPFHFLHFHNIFSNLIVLLKYCLRVSNFIFISGSICFDIVNCGNIFVLTDGGKKDEGEYREEDDGDGMIET